ncbi:MAG: nuclease A inhibitor family protein [Cyanobacteria bacterium P01_A01_bin.68]
MSTNTSEIITKLSNASDGLLWLSESDYPFEPVLWESVEDLTADKLLQQLGKPADTKVEVRDIDQFFRNAIAQEDWHDDEQKAEVKQYPRISHKA